MSSHCLCEFPLKRNLKRLPKHRPETDGLLPPAHLRMWADGCTEADDICLHPRLIYGLKQPQSSLPLPIIFTATDGCIVGHEIWRQSHEDHGIQNANCFPPCRILLATTHGCIETHHICLMLSLINQQQSPRPTSREGADGSVEAHRVGLNLGILGQVRIKRCVKRKNLRPSPKNWKTKSSETTKRTKSHGTFWHSV